MLNAQASQAPNVPLRHPDRLFIGGEWVSPGSGTSIEVVSPSTENVFVRVAEAGEQDMKRAISAARLAFDCGPWPRMSHAARGGYLRQIASALSERVADTSQMWSSEMGIVHSFAYGTTQTIPGIFDYYAGLADTFPFQEAHTPTAGGETGWLVRECADRTHRLQNCSSTIGGLHHCPQMLAGSTDRGICDGRDRRGDWITPRSS